MSVSISIEMFRLVTYAHVVRVASVEKPDVGWLNACAYAFAYFTTGSHLKHEICIAQARERKVFHFLVLVLILPHKCESGRSDNK